MKLIFFSFIIIFNLFNFHLRGEENDLNIANINIYRNRRKIVLSLLEGEKLLHNQEEQLEESSHFYDAIINFYKEGSLVYSFDYNELSKKIELSIGGYEVEVLSAVYPTHYYKDIMITEKSNNLNLYIPIKFVEIKGRVFYKNSSFGGVKLAFEAQNGSKYWSSTNILGEFSITLPQNIYKVYSYKKGYKQKENLEINTRDFKSLENLEIKLVEIPSLIKGYVFDNRNRPMVNTKLNIKNNDIEKVVYTDMDGYYQLEVERGLVFVRANKKGYSPSGAIERVEFFSKKRMNDIFLQELNSSIRGHISSGIRSLRNIRVALYDSNGDFVKSVHSNNRGYYVFEDIMIDKEYYLIIDSPQHKLYKSKRFNLTRRGIDNFNINLEDFNVSFVLELKSNRGLDVSRVEVLVNGQKYKSDINGIINEEIRSEKRIDNLEVFIEKFNIDKKFKISELGQEPYLIQINLDKIEEFKLKELEELEALI